MYLDPDCVRDILLTIEGCDAGEHVTTRTLREKLQNYTLEQIEYTCMILGDGGLLELTQLPMPGRSLSGIKSIERLTYKGHEFLANIRNQNIWTGVKGVASKIGSKSLDALVQIASNVVTELIKAQFGLR